MELLKSIIEYSDFMKVDIRVGKIIEVEDNKKAKVPAFILKIDFGEEIGVKLSSAQLTDNYSKTDLEGKNIVGIVNLKPKYVAGIKSEVLVLGIMSKENGTILLEPEENVNEGVRVL